MKRASQDEAHHLQDYNAIPAPEVLPSRDLIRSFIFISSSINPYVVRWVGILWLQPTPSIYHSDIVTADRPTEQNLPRHNSPTTTRLTG